MLNLTKTVLAVALALCSFAAVAGYAQIKPPPGWTTPKSSGVPATFKTGPAANQNTYKGSTVLTNATLEIGGQVVQVPASLRIAANASVFAASYAFGNPLIFGALAVGAAAYAYYSEQGLTVENGVWVKNGPNNCTVSPCVQYKFAGHLPYYADWVIGAEAATRSTIALYPSENGKYTYTFNKCEVVGYDTNCSYIQRTRVYINEGSPNQTTEYSSFTYGGTISKRTVAPSPGTKLPVGDVEFHTIMDPITVPTAVPKELPEFDWPVEQPAINPNPANIPNTLPSPATPPDSVPIWLPTGDPLKNPNPDPVNKPDTWTQPGKDVKPAGTPSDPWRVDVTDAPKTKGDPSPNIDKPLPTTTTPSPPQDLLTCGLPGKPKCQIDETGTPKYDPKTMELDKATLDAASKTQRETVSATTDKVSMFNPFSQFFTLPPLSSCTPIAMPMYAGQQIASMDVCPAAEWLRGLMGFVWAAAGFAFVFRTVQDVI